MTQLVVAQNKTITLQANWKFRQTGAKQYYPANVPGTVHTDLLKNKLIKDPFYGDNEKSVQWVENENWEYVGTFNCDKATLQNKHIELNFEGLDTYAQVYLNGTQILDCNNMFRSWNVDVKQHLKSGSNTLRIVFESAVKKGKALAAQLPYTLPGDEKVFTRKAQYQYGWDWGPRLVTCGIYKPIHLICWNDIKLQLVHHSIKTLNDSIAEINIITEIKSDTIINYTLSINSYLGDYNLAKLQHYRYYNLKLKKGINIDTSIYTIDFPKLWNTNGLGPATLYSFDVSLKDGNLYNDQTHFKIGLRKLELVKEKDFFGESFYFKLNGEPVFIKGANYIPQDNFVSRVNENHYTKLIQMAKESHMNMLRVWGGGIYESDEFYDLCDRNGILVWQDFMFACAMYPGDSAFVKNVKQEVAQQVKRLHSHPSIALWCGNNESDEGWHNWGWQKQYHYSQQDSAKIWNDYQKIFQEVIPNVIKVFSPPLEGAGGGNYHSSSPSIGWGRKESLLQGDSHYWGVWWGMEPFDIYEKKVGRFMSEYGFQGMPDVNTLKAVCDSNEMQLNSVSIKAHQKHPTGYQTIQTYMERDYKVPTDFRKYNYVSQLLQRDGMKIAIEAHRRAKPYCMGTLYWQLNDCWPVTSWSAIDYNNKPKALYYETKKAYGDVIISIHPERNEYQVFIISDKLNDENAKLEINLKNMKGEILFHEMDSVVVKANSSEIYFSLPEEETKKHDPNEIYISCQLKNTTGELITKTNYCFVKPKDLQLQVPEIKIEYLKEKQSLLITNKNFVKDLYLYSNNPLIEFEDNFIDLEHNSIQILQGN
jgi:beta-mannosidase